MLDCHEGITAQLLRCLPGTADRLAALFFEPPHEFGLPVERAALPLAAVEEITAGITIQLLPAALRSSVRQRQVSFLAGRLCAEEALRIATGRLCKVGRDMSGAPLWPAGMVGSIAHTKDIACAVVAKRAGTFSIGLDIEPIVSDGAREAITEICMCGREAVRFAALGDPNLIATLIFSAKEAFYKAIYPAIGQVIDFNEAEVTSIDLSRGVFRIEATAAYRGRLTLPDTIGRVSLQDRVVFTSAAPRA